ncbi:NAD binding 4 and/or Epimerase domain containing protein, partial [Asbolus verrucosus]
MEDLSDIQKFYKDQTIFITGGTGFIGKLLIEKLLRVCYNLNAIYILIRPKRGKTVQQRFDDIFDYA